MAARVMWTDAEWDKLADLVYPLRIKDLTSPLVTLVTKAMTGIPEDRRRALQGAHQLKPLLDRLERKFRDAKDLPAKVMSLEARLRDAKSSDQILDELSDSEIISRYGSRFLASMTAEELLSQLSPQDILESIPLDVLVSEAARRLVSEHPLIRQINLTGQPPAPIHVDPVKTRLPKVVLVGLMANQQAEVQKAVGHLADLNFVSKERNAGQIPKHADIYVAWSRFCSHSVTEMCKSLARPGHYLQPTGGVGKLIEQLQTKLLDEFYTVKPT